MPATTRKARHAAPRSRQPQSDVTWVVDLTKGTAYRPVHPTMVAARRSGSVLVVAAVAIWTFVFVSLIAHLTG